jgi:hypothetical protein
MMQVGRNIGHLVYSTLIDSWIGLLTIKAFNTLGNIKKSAEYPLPQNVGVNKNCLSFDDGFCPNSGEKGLARWYNEGEHKGELISGTRRSKNSC